MELCNLQVEAPRDFPTLEAIEILAEFRDYSSLIAQTSSGLRTDLVVFSGISMI
jgi:hypothetical protein